MWDFGVETYLPTIEIKIIQPGVQKRKITPQKTKQNKTKRDKSFDWHSWQCACLLCDHQEFEIHFNHKKLGFTVTNSYLKTMLHPNQCLNPVRIEIEYGKNVESSTYICVIELISDLLHFQEGMIAHKTK